MTEKIVIPEPGQHALIVGQTGSGKTVMLAHILRYSTYSPVFVIDTKIDDEFLSLARRDETIKLYRDGIEGFAAFVRAKNVPDYVIIRPPASELMDPMTLDAYVHIVHDYYRGPCIIAVDELYMLHNGGRCGPGITAALTRGRSKKHTFIGATQRPAWVSRFCLSEPSLYYVYRLIDVNDRKRLGHIGYSQSKIMPRYHYYTYNTATGEGGDRTPVAFDWRRNREGGKLLSKWI